MSKAYHHTIQQNTSSIHHKSGLPSTITSTVPTIDCIERNKQKLTMKDSNHRLCTSTTIKTLQQQPLKSQKKYAAAIDSLEIPKRQLTIDHRLRNKITPLLAWSNKLNALQKTTQIRLTTHNCFNNRNRTERNEQKVITNPAGTRTTIETMQQQLIGFTQNPEASI